MSDKPDGGPAFPMLEALGAKDKSCMVYRAVNNGGMSLRDYLVAHAPITLQDAAAYWRDKEPVSYEQVLKTLVAMRIEYADAMLKARES